MSNQVNQVMVFGHVNKEGQMKVNDPAEFVNKIGAYFSGSNICVTVERVERELTHPWRKYYFKYVLGALVQAFKLQGQPMTLADMDAQMRYMFLFEEVRNPITDTWEKRPHTLRAGETKVSQRMFREFCEEIVRWAAEHLDVQIPLFNEGIESQV